MPEGILLLEIMKWLHIWHTSIVNILYSKIQTALSGKGYLHGFKYLNGIIICVTLKKKKKIKNNWKQNFVFCCIQMYM